LASYYIPFLTTLRKLIPVSTALITLSHVGHCPSLAHPKRALTLDEQADAKVEFLNSIWEELSLLRVQEEEEDYHPGRIGLIGHSVGAEIAVLVDRKLRDDRYSDAADTVTLALPSFGLFLLFPTLSNIARTPNAVRLAPLFHAPLLQFLPWLSILIQPLLYAFLIVAKVCKGSSSIYAPNETTLSFLLSPRTISHVLRLAASEMKSIREPDMAWYRKNRERIWTYWGIGDGWVGREGDDMKVVLRGTEGHVEEESSEVSQVVDCTDNVPHAFCLGE
jgi:pimeloyl-ACP methyl ester carboxylesterase